MRETQKIDPEVIKALSQNRKIEAIKLVREKTGMGLKEAKEYVESLENGNRGIDPESQPVRKTATPKKSNNFLLYLFIILAVGYLYFQFAGQ